MSEEIEKKIDALKVTNEEEEGDTVDPWAVTAKDEKGIDYEKLISKSSGSSIARPSEPELCTRGFRAVRELQDRPGAARPDREGDGEAGAPPAAARGLLLPPGHAHHPQRR